MDFLLTFIQLFSGALYLLLPLIGLLFFIITLLGQIVAKVENWSRFDALYWSFITASTVGYGDIRPIKKVSKTLSVFIAIIGMMLSGIIIAVTLKSTGIAFERHIDPLRIERLQHGLK